MKVGFTGTQKGMSARQYLELEGLLDWPPLTELHHGDCIGADAEADSLARGLDLDVVIHPPINNSKRAFCAKSGDIVWEPQEYLERNKDIVDVTDLLIAAPFTDEEELRSGTWSTVRYARKIGKEVIILKR